LIQNLLPLKYFVLDTGDYKSETTATENVRENRGLAAPRDYSINNRDTISSYQTDNCKYWDGEV